MKNRTRKYFQIKAFVKFASHLSGCIEFPHFGASYPDARCIDGYLWDLDACDEFDGKTMLTSGGDDPCPVCNTKRYVQNLLDSEVSVDRIKAHLNYIFNKYGYFKN